VTQEDSTSAEVGPIEAARSVLTDIQQICTTEASTTDGRNAMAEIARLADEASDMLDQWEPIR
jgi:hypothetical protein